ncbi:hypothetical protein HMI54_012510 [Coelomomyces lativittatus]|nr:hypothetical protein HMI54_012510 [Coelomomyces lativittatus]KAJ1506502.1 hypothetical protein HMI56_000585 [Coelomomyces lativittatus]KAJ1513663.1 hypothetical protein HMI55_005334 [Coelomomyces lativittatus]
MKTLHPLSLSFLHFHFHGHSKIIRRGQPSCTSSFSLNRWVSWVRFSSSSSSSEPNEPKHAYAPEVQAWMNTEGAPYEKVRPYTAHFISKYNPLQPFPMNPLFKPVKPLSDEFRSHVFSLHQLDPIEHSIERLAFRFSLSHERIQAVLKLKDLEGQWKTEGRPLQTEFTQGMEEMLQVKELPSLVDEREVRPIQAVPPYFIAIDADQIFEKEDALKLLPHQRKHSTSTPASTMTKEDSNDSKSEFLVQKGRKTWKFNLKPKVQQGFMRKVFK